MSLFSSACLLPSRIQRERERGIKKGERDLAPVIRAIGEMKTPVLANELGLQSFLIETATARQGLCGYPSSYSQTALQSWAAEAGSTSSPSPDGQGGSPLGCRYCRGCTPSMLSGLCWHGVSHGCRIPSERVMAGWCYTAGCFPCLEWKPNK